MSKLFSSAAFLIFLITISFCLFNSKIIAQQTGWIGQDLPPSMSGNNLTNVGDNVIIFTNTNSDIVYFFDTKINSWTEANLGSQQTFQKVLAEGNTAFAYSNEYLVAYSSILSSWDTVRYEGEVIDPSAVSIRKGYGCNDKLAYFATDANIFYVFDSELAQWQQYNFGVILNASGYNLFWAADNYAGAIFERINYDYAKNIAYSLITHSFAELDHGGWYYYPDNIMNGGYVSSWNDAVSQLKYFGYSAYTNQFNSVTFPFGYDVSNFAAWIDNTSYDRLEDIYVYTCGYIVGDSNNRDAFVKSYSTKTGNWYSLQFSFDPNETSGYAWKKGGSFSVGSYYNQNDLAVGVWKFYGNSGTHIGEIPDLFSSQSAFGCGGKVCVGTGEHNLWFHNFENGHTKNVYYAPNPDVTYLKHLGAENYCSVFRYNSASDTMRLFFFNGITNQLQSIQTYKKLNPAPKASPRAFGCVIGGPNNDVIFYSEEKDSVFLYHSAEPYGSINIKNILMRLSVSSTTNIFFDASIPKLYEDNSSLLNINIGDSLIFAKSGDMELKAYSAITKNWKTYQTDQTLNGSNCGDEVALAYSLNFAKYWGYSAYNDSYYELEPEGIPLSPFSIAKGKTGIVIRAGKVYAFSPSFINLIKGEDHPILNNYVLSQNYPNPFNPSTNIEYTIPVEGPKFPSSSHITLKVYDILGREVVTLINKEMKPGSYTVKFNGSKYPSGIYFYRMNTERFIQTKKMLLLK